MSVAFCISHEVMAKEDNEFQEPINVRITREEFAEIHDTLIIENENKKIKIKDLYFSSFDLMTGDLISDEIFSVKSPKFEPGIFSRMQQEEKQESKIVSAPTKQKNNDGIHNIKLSSNIDNRRKSNQNNQDSKDLSSPVQKSFLIKLKNTALLIKNNEKTIDINNNLEELIKLSEGKPQNLSNIARLYIKINELDKACELLQKAEESSPDDYKVVYTYATCLYKNKNFELAEQKLKKVTALKPDFMYAYYNLGNIHFKKKDYHAAIDSFKKAMGLAPEKADVYFNIGLTLEMLDYRELAKKFYTKCLQLNPMDKGAIKALKKLN